MIDYSPLWNTLKSKGISQYRLIRSYHFSSGQLHRIRKNEHVSTHTLETLCRILNCSVADIVRISFDRVEKRIVKISGLYRNSFPVKISINSPYFPSPRPRKKPPSHPRSGSPGSGRASPTYASKHMYSSSDGSSGRSLSQTP